MSLCSCSSAIKKFNDWITPERVLHRKKLGPFYRENPIMSRVLITPLAVISGMLKVPLFPVFCAAGVLWMPIKAIIDSCQGKENGTDWLKAWCFCVLGLAGSAAFVVICYHLPLVAAAALFISCMAVSIVIHVYRLVKEPTKPTQPQLLPN